MEGQRDHALHRGEVDLDQPVVAGALPGGKRPVFAAAPVHFKVRLHRPVRGPDAAEGRTLGGHHIDAHAVLHGQAAHAGTHKFQNFVLVKPACKGCPHQGQGHVHGAHAGPRAPRKPHGDHRRALKVVGAAKQLLGHLAAALPDAHGSQSSVAGVAVRAKDHFPAARHHLPHVLVQHRPVGRHENAAVAFDIGQAEHVVVLIDGSAHRAQGVVAVAEHIGHREFLNSAGPRGLQNAHIVVVRGYQGVEFEPQVFHVVPLVVRF